MAKPRLDAVCAKAVDLARSAAEEIADPGTVGEHLTVQVSGERLVTHLFDCTATGYRGWRWAVSLARAPRQKSPTVCEVDLVAGPDSIVAPQWLPWSDRLRPGDLAPGDVLPKVPDDTRLEQGFEATGDEDVDQVANWELGLGRPRVLSREGRLEAGDRWQSGDFGADSAFAKQAPSKCRNCGFLLPMAGALRQEFGICTNEWSPGDGHVVSLNFGCGAHSEVVEEKPAEQSATPLIDDQAVDLVVIPVHRSDDS